MRRFLSPASRRAFTLIELLVVMVIILILAGLILSVAGHANYKAAFARAGTDVQHMSTAMESYKVDNGTYPRSTDTDALNAQDAASKDASVYVAASKFLYQELSGINNSATNSKRAYIAFTPGQLSTANAAPSAGTTYLVDPFGLSYGYSTAGQTEQDRVNSTTPPGTVDTTKGYNPTFDLWSTGGYGAGGKAYPADVTATQYNTLWAKNW